MSMVNAWIFLNEDEPSGTNYDSKDSCYQRLITQKIYDSVDLLYMTFFSIVPTSATTIPAGDGSSYTLEMGDASHPGGLTNQDYMDYILRDAKAVNPEILFGATLLWGNASEISQIFAGASSPKQAAAAFAANLVAYMQHYGLRAFDIDWEEPLSSGTTQQQYADLIEAIGTQFAKQTDKHYLTVSPAETNNIDPTTTNAYVDFMNLQLYFSSAVPQWLEQQGVDSRLFAYGAKWESGYQTAQQAYDDNRNNYGYSIYTAWRLNSDDFEFEQDQQVALHGLVEPSAAQTG